MPTVTGDVFILSIITSYCLPFEILVESEGESIGHMFSVSGLKITLGFRSMSNLKSLEVILVLKDTITHKAIQIFSIECGDSH